MELVIKYEQKITKIEKSICEKYWLIKDPAKRNFEYSCKQIEEKFSINYQQINKIIRSKSSLLVFDCNCMDCGIKKICKTRSELKKTKLKNWRCSNCKETFFEHKNKGWTKQYYWLNNLSDERKHAKIERLCNYINSHQANPKPFNDLNEPHKFYISAIIESLGTNNLKTSISLRHKLYLPLTPSSIMDTKVLELLFKENILLINYKNSFNNVIYDELDNIVIDYNNATFDFAYDTEQLKEISLYVKEKRDINCTIYNNIFKRRCQEIQIAECFNYLIYYSKMLGLVPTIDSKLNNLLRIGLLDYSVAEMIPIIFKSIEDSAKQANKLDLKFIQASSLISGNIQYQIDRASYGLQDQQRIIRNSAFPQSAIAKIFFDNIFDMKDCGFNYTLKDLLSIYKKS